MQFTVVGDRINYPGEVATPTSGILVAKRIDIAILMKGAKYMTIDISNFYLMTPLSGPEYTCIKLNNLPNEIIHEYNLMDKATKDGSIYIKANKGIYGLP